MQVDVWSDIVCPWCYIGKRRFERALAEFPARAEVLIRHRAFQLNPGAPKSTTSSRKAYLMAKYGWSDAQANAADARMQQLAAAEGLDYHLAGTSTGNTFDAHRLVHAAREHGREQEMLERLYRAYFTEQRSIFDTDSLVAIAPDGGLDAAAARDVLDGSAYADAVAADIQDAAALRVSGVPFFVLDGRLAISGAQPADIFSEALRRAS